MIDMKQKILITAILVGIIIGTISSFAYNYFYVDKSVISSTLPSENAEPVVEIFAEPVYLISEGGSETMIESGYAVKENDRIRTDAGARAQIVFPNGTVTRLDESTVVHLASASYQPQKIRIEIEEGHVWSRVAKMSSSEYYQTVSNKILTEVKGTSFGHYVFPDGSDKVVTTKGEVVGQCINNTQKTVIARDNKILFDCLPTSKQSPEPISSDDTRDAWFQFNVEEDAFLNNRFGPYAYNDSEDNNVLGESDESFLDRARRVVQTVLGVEDDTPSTTIVQQPTPTTTPSVVPTSASGPTATPKPNPTTSTSSPGTGSQPTNTPVPPKVTTPIPTQGPSRTAIASIRITGSSTGGVSITDSLTGSTTTASDGSPVYSGATVETSANAKAEIMFENGSVTRLDGNTEVVVQPNNEESFNMSIILNAGRIWSRVKKLTGSDEGYETQTDSMVATVRGTSYGHAIVEEEGRKADRIVTVEGSVLGRCMNKAGQRSNQMVTEIQKNHKGTFRCLNERPEVIKDQITSISSKDIAWTLTNMQLDELLEQKNPDIIYYDPGTPPDRISLNEPPSVEIIATDSVRIQEALDLRAKIRDDGLPFGVQPNIIWSQSEGPRCFNNNPCTYFTRIVDPKTSAVFLKPGTYTLRATSSDILSINYQEIVVTVSGNNQPPQVEAGEQKKLTLHRSGVPEKTKIQLTGMVEDDGLPYTESLTYGWSQTAGPEGGATILNPGNAKTWVQFSKSGSYNFTLSADDGEYTTVDTVTITVAEPLNEAPQVYLGPDRTVAPQLRKNGKVVPATLSIYPRIVHDNYPLKNPEYTWEIVQTPDDVTAEECVQFGKDDDQYNTLRPQMRFSCPGTFTMRLTADDSLEQGSDELLVTVLEPGSDVEPFEPLAEMFMSDSADEDRKVSINIQNIFDYKFMTYSLTYECDSENPDVCAEGTYGVQSQDLIPIDQNEFVRVFPFKTCSSNGNCTLHENVRNVMLEVQLYKNKNKEPQQTLLITETSVNNPPEVAAGDDVTAFVGDTVQLNGRVEDSDIPTNSTLNIAWSLASGPGAVTFTDPQAPSTSAQFDQPGQYTLTLTGSDGFLTISDTVDVVIEPEPENTAPMVDAGFNQVVVLPATANLAGSAIDDGIPAEQLLTYQWQMTGGPAEAAIESPFEPVTIAEFSEPGTYQFTLTVSDGDLQSSDMVQIEVKENMPPEVSAGDDTATTIDRALLLEGTASDDGYPMSIPLETMWRQISGPENGAAIFTEPAKVQTTVRFSETGEYVLALTADDSEHLATDSMRVVVNEPVAGVDEVRVVELVESTNEVCLGFIDGVCMTGTTAEIVVEITGSRMNTIEKVSITPVDALETTIEATPFEQADSMLRVSYSDLPYKSPLPWLSVLINRTYNIHIVDKQGNTIEIERGLVVGN
jgi:hypothetical protein